MNRIEAAAVEIRRLEKNDRVAWEDLWQENLDHFAAPDRARADMPVIWQRLMDEAAPLLGWLRVNVHRKASSATTDELMTAATGAPLGAAAFKTHIEARYLAPEG